jgi:predicted Zn-dependent peptidase
VEKTVDEETERIVDTGVTEQALKGAQAQLRRDWLDRLAHPGSRAEELCAGEAYLGDPTAMEGHLDRMPEITVDDVRAVAAEHLLPGHRAVLTYEVRAQGAPA